MLDRIIGWSLRNRAVVLTLAVLLVVFGIYSAETSPLDVFPKFAPPRVVIRTEAPGFSPEEVESLVTVPIEYALNGMSDLQTLRSSSWVGLSGVTAIFQPGTDIFRARQLVGERLQLVQKQLPQGVSEPEMKPIVAAVGIIDHLALTAPHTSMMELRTFADWTIRPRLLGTPGVAQVVITGGEQKQYQVIVDPIKLKDYGVTLSQVMQAAKLSNQNAGAGFMVRGGQSFVIQGLGRVHNVNDVANAVVALKNGVPVTIRQVAQVEVAPAFKIGDASMGETPCVYITVLKQPGANTLSTSKALDQAMKDLRSALPADVKVTYVFRQADFIELAIHNINTAILEGGIIVVLVLLLFLFSWRTGVISLAAIPLSILAAIIVLKEMGATINTMTLGGLAVAIGELVDDAIVDVENVFRRLRENRLKEQPDSIFAVIFHASSEIRHSIIYATFIVILVFLPIFEMGGLAGRIFAPLGEAYILSIIASLLVALTVTPALCYFLLPRAAVTAVADSPTVDWLKRNYARVLKPLLNHPKKVMAASAVLLAAALAAMPFLGGEFLPQFNEGNLVIRMTALPGTALNETMRLGKAAMRRLHQVPEVATTVQRAGRAELDEDALGTNANEIDVLLKPSRRGRKQVLADVRKKLSAVPGVNFDVEQFISERIEEVLAGSTGMIVVKVFGPDLTVLREKAGEIQQVMSRIPSVVDLQTEPLETIPKVEIRFNRQALAQAGMSSGGLAAIIETAFRGTEVSGVFDQQRTFGLLVRMDPRPVGDPDTGPARPAAESLKAIRDMWIDTAEGGKIPLSTLAAVRIVNGPGTINRENAQRRIAIQANAAGLSLTRAVQEIQRRVSQRVHLPLGYYMVYGGQYEAQAAARQRLLLFGGAAAAGIFLLLLMAFRSARDSLLVMANLPLAFIGSVLAVVLTGGTLSVGSMVGFIAVLGIVMRNGIMLITHYHHLMKFEGMSFGRELVERGAMERLSPILMTAMTAGLGLLPLAISFGKPGRELEQPMAVVILGGLITSTLLNMAVIPALYLKFGTPLAEDEGRAGPA
ncbi:MAG: efflux RND transporter permease subunit [Terriglobia bacterium]